jgi:hypothetical protein
MNDRQRIEKDLVEYYQCPPELVEQAADAVEYGQDAAETVEALIGLGEIDGGGE